MRNFYIYAALLVTLSPSLPLHAESSIPSQEAIKQKLSRLGSQSFRCEILGMVQNSKSLVVAVNGEFSPTQDYIYVLAMDEDAALIQALNKLEAGKNPKGELVTVNFRHNPGETVFITDGSCKIVAERK